MASRIRLLRFSCNALGSFVGSNRLVVVEALLVPNFDIVVKLKAVKELVGSLVLLLIDDKVALNITPGHPADRFIAPPVRFLVFVALDHLILKLDQRLQFVKGRVN